MTYVRHLLHAEGGSFDDLHLCFAVVVNDQDAVNLTDHIACSADAITVGTKGNVCCY